MAIQQLPFPLQYIRQFAGSLDRDSIFASTDARINYLSNPIRYGGQVVVDLELEEVFYLNAAKTEWLPITGSNAVSFDDIVEDIIGSGNPQELGSTAAIVAYVQSMIANAAAYGIKFYAADDAARQANTPDPVDVKSYLLQEDTRKVYQWEEVSTGVYDWVFRFDLDSPTSIENVLGLQAALDSKVKQLTINNLVKLPDVNGNISFSVGTVVTPGGGIRAVHNSDSNTGSYALNLGFPWAGRESIVTGFFGMGIGIAPVATGTAAISFGDYCQATGPYTWASGQYTTATHPGAKAMGSRADALNNHAFASGGTDRDSHGRLVVNGWWGFAHTQYINSPYNVSGANSAVLGGVNLGTSSAAARSIVLGGNQREETLPDTVNVPNLRLTGSMMNAAGEPIIFKTASQIGADGHTIVDENDDPLPQRSKLKFVGAEVTDDVNTTVVTILANSADYTPADSDNTAGFFAGLLTSGKLAIKVALDKIVSTIGLTSNLTTDAKGNLVDAINEVNNKLEEAGAVDTVNGQAPDVNKNVLIEAQHIDVTPSDAGFFIGLLVDGKLKIKAAIDKIVDSVKTNTTNIANNSTDIATNATNIQTVNNNLQNHNHEGVYATASHFHAGVYEPVFNKNTGFNKNFGTTADTVSEGNHNHDSSYVLKNAPITGTTATKITYDAKGLVTAGAAATTADIVDSTNRRYVTDAQQTVIGNTSGTNSGNETASTLGTTANAATAKTTLVDADNILTTDSAASHILKKWTFANVKANLKSYFDTLYQATLVSGTNIKTINGSSVLGSGNITIAGGGAGTPANNNYTTGTPAITLTTTEQTVGTITITPTSTSSKIMVIATQEYTKDGSTTVRIATARVRRGITNGDVQVGADSVVRSLNVATTAFGPAVVAAVDTPNTTNEVTYSIRALTDGGSPTVTRFTIQVFELALKGEKGDSATATTDASQLTTGTLADARLSTNVPLKNVLADFTGGLQESGVNLSDKYASKFWSYEEVTGDRTITAADHNKVLIYNSVNPATFYIGEITQVGLDIVVHQLDAGTVSFVKLGGNHAFNSATGGGPVTTRGAGGTVSLRSYFTNKYSWLYSYLGGAATSGGGAANLQYNAVYELGVDSADVQYFAGQHEVISDTLPAKITSVAYATKLDTDTVYTTRNSLTDVNTWVVSSVGTSQWELKRTITPVANATGQAAIKVKYKELT
jgi:hypothetical protein